MVEKEKKKNGHDVHSWPTVSRCPLTFQLLLREKQRPLQLNEGEKWYARLFFLTFAHDEKHLHPDPALPVRPSIVSMVQNEPPSLFNLSMSYNCWKYDQMVSDTFYIVPVKWSPHTCGRLLVTYYWWLGTWPGQLSHGVIRKRLIGPGEPHIMFIFSEKVSDSEQVGRWQTEWKWEPRAAVCTCKENEATL